MQARELSAPAESGLVVDEVLRPAEVVLGRLRCRYRRWGVAVLFDGHTTWTAVRGRFEPIVRQTLSRCGWRSTQP